MWLVSHNTILTKDNLTLKGWVGDQTCHFCSEHESINHLFITCNLAQQIWFYLGKSQWVMQNWHTWDDILHFAQTLDYANRTGFMIVLSAVSWSIWKHRNEVCFTNGHVKTARSLILLIKTNFFYKP